jgi:protein-disulfide isomerase
MSVSLLTVLVVSWGGFSSGGPGSLAPVRPVERSAADRIAPPDPVASEAAPAPEPPQKPLPPEPPISPRELHARISPSVVALVVSGGNAAATVASGVTVTASGFVLTSRHAIADAVDGGASLALVSGGAHGRCSPRELTAAVPARVVALSNELDLAMVEALPPDATFFPHLPIARRRTIDGTTVLAVGHGKKRGLWSATPTPIGPAVGAVGNQRWMRRLSPTAESSTLEAGTPLVDSVGRVVALVVEPSGHADGPIAVDGDALVRFLLAAQANELRFAGVPPMRRKTPGTIVVARPTGAKHKDASTPTTANAKSAGVTSQPRELAAESMPGVVRKGSLDRNFPGKAIAQTAITTDASTAARAGGEAAFRPTSNALTILAADLDRHPNSAMLRVDADDAPSRGPDDAPVTIVQFGDYHSPDTRDAESTVRDLVDGKAASARLLWKDADRGDGDDYLLPARAARAAAEQDEFWSMHDRLLKSGSSPNMDRVRKLAHEIDLDAQVFTVALDSDGLASAVESDSQRAGHAPFFATPAFVVNGLVVDGGSIAGPALRAAVDEELLAHGPKQAVAIARPPRAIASGAALAGAAFDPAKMARTIADAAARRSAKASTTTTAARHP